MAYQRKRLALTNKKQETMTTTYWASLYEKSTGRSADIVVGLEDTPYVWGEYLGKLTMSDMDRRVIEFLDVSYPETYGSGDWNTNLTIGRDKVIDYLADCIDDGYVNPLVASRVLKYPELIKKIVRGASTSPSWYRLDGIDVDNRRNRFIDRLRKEPKYIGKPIESDWLKSHSHGRNDPANLSLLLHLCESGTLRMAFNPLVKEKVLATDSEVDEGNWFKTYLPGYIWHDHRINSDLGYTRNNTVSLPAEVHLYVHSVAKQRGVVDTTEILKELGWLQDATPLTENPVYVS